MDRRSFLTMGVAGGVVLLVTDVRGVARLFAVPAPGTTVDPASIPQFVTPLLIPPAMPRSGQAKAPGGGTIDLYEISMRQLTQQVLPAGLPPTTVWGYGPNPATALGPVVFNAPSLTVEATHGRPVRIRWINELVDAQGHYLPHLLPVDPTLHWANPPGGESARDTRPTFTETPGPYTGPVPMVTHVHGAVGVGDESDGYAEAWFLPDAVDIPDGYARAGTWYDFFAAKSADRFGVAWSPGSSVSHYPNVDRASANWYHDHTLGMTRLNVYAGPAGFYIIRGGPGDKVTDARTGRPAVLPGPAPQLGDAPGTRYYEIPLAIQDRTFREDGSLFYPDTRAFFDGIEGPYLPDSDVSPIWNPEFFGDTIIVNGATWPVLDVEQRRYRFRVLNGCGSRFLILDFTGIPGAEVWQIGNEGGFLAAPIDLGAVSAGRLLMAPAERADLVVDFTNVPEGQWVLGNVGPDEPFGGGVPGVDFPVADPTTTGRVMAFRVGRRRGRDRSTPPGMLVLPPITPLPPEEVTRRLALVEIMSESFDGPAEAVLGTIHDDPAVGPAMWTTHGWMEDVTEAIDVGATERWEIYNVTADAHPIHLHEVAFEVVDRQPVVVDEMMGTVELDPTAPVRPPEPWESGVKDTVIAYPGEVTRIRARFSTAGQYVWHCHVVEHEDNEMMRPMRVGPEQTGQPMPRGHVGHA